MKLISVNGLGAGYGDVTAEHVKASAKALNEVARLVTADPEVPDVRPLHVRLSHFEHGGMLSLQLFGFSVLPATGQSVTIPFPPGMTERPPATGLRPPEEASAQAPTIYAVVANHPVPAQIEHTLASLAKLVARQELRAAGKDIDVAELDTLATAVDTEAETSVTDMFRSQGWRATAQALSVRSAAAGVPLVVAYSPVLMDPTALALRAPILRRVYNEMPNVRSAIDKVAAYLSQGLISIGGGSEQISAYVRDYLDVGDTRTYLAHLVRDALVCGNGYLAFGPMPDEDIRLLRPEHVTALDGNTVRVSEGDAETIYKPVLHDAGAEQCDSPYGLSVLEPFVSLQIRRELMLQTIEFADFYGQPSVPEPLRTKAVQNVPLARRTLESIDKQIAATLGSLRSFQAESPPDLYFPGHELMAPASAGLALITDDSQSSPATWQRP
jgi:hypothetical protein